MRDLISDWSSHWGQDSISAILQTNLSLLFSDAAIHYSNGLLTIGNATRYSLNHDEQLNKMAPLGQIVAEYNISMENWFIPSKRNKMFAKHALQMNKTSILRKDVWRKFRMIVLLDIYLPNLYHVWKIMASRVSISV